MWWACCTGKALKPNPVPPAAPTMKLAGCLEDKPQSGKSPTRPVLTATWSPGEKWQDPPSPRLRLGEHSRQAIDATFILIHCKKHGALALFKNIRYSEGSVWRKWLGYKRLNQDASNSSVLEAILQYQPNAYIILLKFHPRLIFLHSLFTSQPALLNTIFSWWPKCNPVGSQVG